jgi:hypothetical protein
MPPGLPSEMARRCSVSHKPLASSIRFDALCAGAASGVTASAIHLGFLAWARGRGPLPEPTSPRDPRSDGVARLHLRLDADRNSVGRVDGGWNHLRYSRRRSAPDSRGRLATDVRRNSACCCSCATRVVDPVLASASRSRVSTTGLDSRRLSPRCNRHRCGAGVASNTGREIRPGRGIHRPEWIGPRGHRRAGERCRPRVSYARPVT